MSDLQIPAEVEEFLSSSGVHLDLDADGLGFEAGDSETSNVVRIEGDEYVVRTVSRGVVERVVLRTADVETVWRFIVVVHAFTYRERYGLPRLLAATRPPIPASVTLDWIAPRRAIVRWCAAGVEHRASELDRVDDEDLARAVAYPLSTVISAVRRPDGAPVFGPPERHHAGTGA